MNKDLILKDVTDPILRENFVRIQDFINQNVLFRPDFKFFEVDVPVASYAYAIPHGLTYSPTDIVLLNADGDLNFYFRYSETDRNNIYVASHGPVRLRFLAGRYSDQGRRILKDSQLPFVAPNIGQVTGTLSGAGSDGWAFIQDSVYTSSNPIPAPAGVRTQIKNDGAGPLTNYENAPANSSSWWDPVHSIFWPSKNGEFYTFRINFRIKPVLNNTNATLFVDIGTSNPAVTKTFYLTKGAGVESMFSEPLPVAIGPAPLTNGIRFYIKCDCDASIYGINLTVIRDFHK